jgi:hypothetical protein
MRSDTGRKDPGAVRLLKSLQAESWTKLSVAKSSRNLTIWERKEGITQENILREVLKDVHGISLMVEKPTVRPSSHQREMPSS